MAYVVIKTGLHTLAREILSDEVRAGMEQEVAFAVDKDLKTQGAQYSDKASDDHINFNFRRSWRTGKVPIKSAIGTSYDYFNQVVLQAVGLFQRWGGSMLDPDWIGQEMYGKTTEGYSSSIGVWDNGNEVPLLAPLKGPQVDVGPKIDYGLFLERWIQRKSEFPYRGVLMSVGVVHAIAARLNADWEGVHHIYPMTSKPGKGKNSVRLNPDQRTRRKEPIETFPFIRIQTRHR